MSGSSNADWPTRDSGALEAESGRPPHLEVELKYAVRDRAGLSELLERGELAGYQAGAPHLALVEDRYVDTADRALERAGYAARLRRRAEGMTIELKSLHSVRNQEVGTEALHRREELSGPAVDDLRPETWPESVARAHLCHLAGGAPLVERFRLRQRREERELTGAGGTILLTMDTADVLLDDHLLGTLGDLELELATGGESQMAALAAALEASGLVDPEQASKFQRAVALADDHAARQPGQPAVVSAAVSAMVEEGTVESGRARADEVEVAQGEAAQREATQRGAAQGEATQREATQGEAAAASDTAVARLGLSVGRAPGVQAGDPLAEAGRKILRFHLARMLLREPGARAGGDPEDLHAMRVATRRMRAAWRVFGDAYRPRRVRRYIDELRGLAAALGRVRDLDVLIEGLDAYVSDLPSAEATAIAPLCSAWRNERAQARRALAQILESDAYRRFVEDYVEFVRTEGAGAARMTPTQPQRVRDSAGSRIWSAYEQVRAYDAVLRWADIATLHQLRIAGKRLRYTIEFFREPLGPEGPLLIERVTALQDHLGLLHDADVAATLARTFLVERSAHLAPPTVDAVGRYLRNREQEVTHLRRTLAPVWRRIVSLEFRRSLARAISVL